MAKRDLLAEAIADVDQIKKAAIQVAKSSLAEHFEPAIKDLLSQKLSEADDEDEVGEEDMDENTEVYESKKKKDDGEDESPSDDEEVDEAIDIDAILAEIEAGDEDEEDAPIDEKKKAPKADTEDEAPAEDEEGDLDEDIDLNQLLSELSETKDEESAEEDEEVDEVYTGGEDALIKFGQFIADTIPALKGVDPKTIAGTFFGMLAGGPITAVALKQTYDKVKSKLSGKKPAKPSDGKEAPAVSEDTAKMQKELQEVTKKCNRLVSAVNETNLINAKLLYLNKVLAEASLDTKQKIKVIKAFDKAGTVKEAKLVYESLSEALKPKSVKKSIKESLGFSSKAVGTSTGKKQKQKQITESNDSYTVAKWAEMANIKD